MEHKSCCGNDTLKQLSSTEINSKTRILLTKVFYEFSLYLRTINSINTDERILSWLFANLTQTATNFRRHFINLNQRIVCCSINLQQMNKDKTDLFVGIPLIISVSINAISQTTFIVYQSKKINLHDHSLFKSIFFYHFPYFSELRSFCLF